MTVRVRLFATLRERAGLDSIEVELEDGATVADALEQIARRPQLSELVRRLPVALAVNRDYADAATPLRGEDELALIPPISGGASGVHVRVTESRLSVEEVSRIVASPAAGAIVTFQGVTREVASLDYEVYREMAEQRIVRILERCVAEHGLTGAAAEHRVGSVALGEPGVIVAVSAAHRGPAFAGASEAIDRIKAEAPIWKRELDGRGGARWVEGQAVGQER